MIKYTAGDLLRESATAIVNPVNCVGVMGKGLALQFKRAWPENYARYKRACGRGEVQPGKSFIYDTGKAAPRYIVNFPTKRHWKDNSLLKDVESGLIELRSWLTDNKIDSIAIPPLGCGLGGLNWEEVRALIEKYLGDLSGVDVVVFEPPAPTLKTGSESRSLPLLRGRLS